MHITASLLCSLISSSPTGETPTSFALVVTNNRSLDPSRPDLRYADDDGVEYAELYSQLFGASHVVLLTELDPESRVLHPGWAAIARAPTRENLEQVVRALSSSIAAARSRQEPVELHLVFAGHGDAELGSGFIELADVRLTAADLETGVIDALAADRTHLILDSCNSYFMLNPRKPGGRRWLRAADASEGLLDRHPSLGAILSSSAEAVTYEWSELQSGVFSYEVRSGLRGAADADGDGVIRHEELAAFVETANRRLPNDQYRPKVFARAPKGSDDTLVRLHAAPGPWLQLPASSERRMTLRNANGVRLLDLHKDNEGGLRLLLPVGIDAVDCLILERPEGRERPLFRSCAILAEGSLEVRDPSVPALAPRGEAPVFERLFDEPFGRAALSRYQQELKDASPEFPGVNGKDLQRLGIFLENTAALERDSRRLSGMLFLGLASVLGLPAVASLAKNEGDGLAWAAAVSSGGLLAAGVTALVLPTGTEDLAAAFSSQDFSTERLRAKAVLDAERSLNDLAEDYRYTRYVTGGSLILVGLASGVMSIASDRTGTLERFAPAGAGVALLGAGLYTLFFHRYPVERSVELYRADAGLEASSLDLNVGATVLPGGGGISLGGRF